MHKVIALAFFASALVLQGCGSDSQSVKAPELEIPVVDPDTTGGRPLVEFERALAARRSKGDTAVISHELLQKMLSDSIAGYLLEIDKASTFETPNFTFAEASKVFYNAAEQYIELTAGDYVRNPDFLRVNLQRFNLAQGVEISGMRDQKLNPQAIGAEGRNVFAWEAYNSRKKIAWAYIGLEDRYFITIEATAQPGFLEHDRLRSWMDLSKLPAPK